MLGTMVVAACLAGPAFARTPHVPHKPHPPRQPRPPDAQPPDGGGDAGANVHLAVAQQGALPGRGTSLAWAPDGHALAVGGHFRPGRTTLRYDTNIYDVASNTVTRTFDCHYYWTVAEAWSANPYLGEVIVDGAADHVVKVWSADGAGSTRCVPGQFKAADGGLRRLSDVNGWITSLAFSPDGRFLAGASRDRTIRIWQIEPGANQGMVVRLWYDKTATNFTSVDWAPDGHALVTADRSGRVAVWSFDPAADLWDDDTIARFAALGWEGQPGWFAAHAAQLARTPVWSEGGHKQVWRARFSPDGTQVGAAGTDGVVSVWAADSGRVVYRTAAPHATPFFGFDWSPDGTYLAGGGADGTIYVFTAADGVLYDRLVGHEDGVTAVAWSPDGQTLASTASGALIAFVTHDYATGPDQSIILWRRR
jgi:WD40 repeat protein